MGCFFTWGHDLPISPWYTSNRKNLADFSYYSARALAALGMFRWYYIIIS